MGKGDLLRMSLILFLMAISGFMSFFFMRQLIFVLFPFLLYWFLSRRVSYPSRFRCLLLLFVILLLLQTFFHEGVYSVVLTQALRLFTISLIAMFIGLRFKGLYLKLVYWICLLSLILWTGCMIVPGFESFLLRLAEFLPEFRSTEFLETTTNPSKSLYFYTVSTVGSIRNSGPFFEPGMYAVFVILALVMSLFGDNRLLSRYNVVFILTIITTFSTSGYLALFFLLLVYVYIRRGHLFFKLLLLLCLPVLLLQFLRISFISDKIAEEIEYRDLSYSRIGAMYYHWEKIRQSPLVGFGMNPWPVTPMDAYVPEGAVSPNGLTIIAVIWGIPFTILYFLLLYCAVSCLVDARSTMVRVVAFVAVLLVLFSQDVTNREIFYMLIFWGGLYYGKTVERCLT